MNSSTTRKGTEPAQQYQSPDRAGERAVTLRGKALATPTLRSRLTA